MHELFIHASHAHGRSVFLTSSEEGPGVAPCSDTLRGNVHFPTQQSGGLLCEETLTQMRASNDLDIKHSPNPCEDSVMITTLLQTLALVPSCRVPFRARKTGRLFLFSALVNRGDRGGRPYCCHCRRVP